MIQRFNRNDRRILSFPAVHPCESVSPVTLLRSLINLSTNICNYQTKFYATQRRNVRETIRQIGVLNMFLEEIRERNLVLSDSIILCLSDLHMTFQKILFLMEDCSREGARVWILIKSQFVSTQFRVLIRAVATALDVLPLHLIQVGIEVNELVELVAKQARKAKLELDKDDEFARKRLLSIVDLFEKGIEPELGYIKWVLDYLEIKTWSDCNKEIKFLEEEIGFQCLDCEDREIPFLCSLAGIMNYFRGVIYDTFDYRNNKKDDQMNVKCNMETLACLNPEDFRCPISLELMTDPVTVSTGHTYDRSSIQKWLKAGNNSCPKTGERLQNTELVPNTILRKLIQHFCADNGISLAKFIKQSRDIRQTIVPGSLAYKEAMKFLSKFLARRLVFGSGEERNKAAYEIRLLAKSNIFNRSCLIEAGTILPLLNISSSIDKSTQENAMAALLKLSKHSSGQRGIVEIGGLATILAVLKRGQSLEARQIAAATLFYLSSVKGYRKLIGETPGAFPALVDLIKDGTTCGKKNAIVTIFGLALYHGNHQRVLSAGTVPLLLDIIASSDKADVVADSLAVLSTLAESIDGTFAILQASALPVILRMLQSSASRAANEYCASILLSLCINVGDEVIPVLAKDPSLMRSLYSVISDGTSNGSKKACSLVRILHKFNETSSSGLSGPAFPHEQSSVHVW
ncbi:U-box domain-containing protein [Cephalotus follicularis]|uniref:RING-type E3 ubiquitin transferase n=1 Tax=Cephalotus follicularis TaxID=3775 RepID=A0A1Q3B4U6_CEPFO|nr:U-box domain-containing protein [Cephalotus follicularis]